MSHDVSILDSTKKALGLAPTYDVFDVELVMYINSVFMKLQQLGIGPDQGFMIEDASAKWTDFLGESLQYTTIPTYMAMSVRMLFDPPGTSFLMSSYEKTIEQMEFRLTIQRDEFGETPIVIPSSGDPIYVDLDGGGA